MVNRQKVPTKALMLNWMIVAEFTGVNNMLDSGKQQKATSRMVQVTNRYKPRIKWVAYWWLRSGGLEPTNITIEMMGLPNTEMLPNA